MESPATHERPVGQGLGGAQCSINHYLVPSPANQGRRNLHVAHCLHTTVFAHCNDGHGGRVYFRWNPQNSSHLRDFTHCDLDTPPMKSLLDLNLSRIVKVTLRDFETRR